MAAVKAIAALAKEAVPEDIKKIYSEPNLTFGKTYIIPKPTDKRLLTHVSLQVAMAAVASGVARKQIKDWERYQDSLIERGRRLETKLQER